MAVFPRYLWIKGKRLYLYDQYESRTDAWKTAKYYQKKLKNNYYILATETFWTNSKMYGLYMNKVIGFR